MRRPVVLLVCLGAVSVAFLAMRPALRRMGESARSIDRETDRMVAEAGRDGALADALKRARAAAQASPSDPAVLVEWAGAAQDAGLPDEALEAIGRAERLRPGDPMPLLAKADILQRAHRYDEAIDAYKSLLKVEPNLPRAVAGLALIYLSMAWTAEARDLLERAVAMHGGDRPLRTALALACVQHNEFAKAEGILLGLQADAPADAAVQGPLADLYLKASRPKDALTVLERARARFGDDPRIATGIAQACLALGDARRAEAEAAKGLRSAPGTIPLEWQRALALQRLGRAEEATALLASIHARDPDHESVRLLLGQAWIRAGKRSEGAALLAEHRKGTAAAAARARASLKVSMNPRDPAAHLAMARIHRAEEATGRMRAELRRVLELDPKSQTAREWLEAVQ